MRLNRNEPYDQRQLRRGQRVFNNSILNNHYSNTYNRYARQQNFGAGVRAFKITKFIIITLIVFFLVSKIVYNTYSSKSTSIRIFGPVNGNSSEYNNMLEFGSFNDEEISFKFFTRQEQRNFLLSEHGWTCNEASNKNQKVSVDKSNLLVQRFDQLPTEYGTELWKYCVLYSGVWNLYWQTDNLIPLQLIDSILGVPSRKGIQSSSDGTTTKRSRSNSNLVIQIAGVLNDRDGKGTTQSLEADEPSSRLHHSFLRLSKSKSKVALGMMRYLLDYDPTNYSTNNNLVPLDTLSLQQTLSMFVANDKQKKRNQWQFWTAKCRDAPLHVFGTEQQLFTGISTPTVDAPCSAEAGEACCQVWTGPFTAMKHTPPSLLIQHSNIVRSEETLKRTSNELPFSIQSSDPTELKVVVSDEHLGMSKSHLPYIATVREYPTNVPPATVYETPNYFDILLRNNCLPHDKECFKCLKLGYKEGDDGGDCTLCHEECPCYCNALCQVRPPPKRMAAEWVVTPPRFRKNPDRIIPRVIHQTWFEPVTREKYPNMSRLIESFRKSGWEYEFYNDEKAAQFLSAHFPSAVREAYDALIPGAFKADLFRYCVLLIRGGLYADMDILLESNLDESIPADVGFLTAQDSPGETIGHRSCLWNGLMAVAPAHPVLAQTIQTVVNNIRNRFTSVDYDDMLCPNPVLSVSHTVDTLFTCGPCILGASLNDVLKRHRQTGYDYGEIDLFATEKNLAGLTDNRGGSRGPSQHYLSLVDPDDPRWLIPGRMMLLKQNKADMGSHRFTATDKNLIVAVTDMPEYDDRPKSIEHYSKSHVKFGVYGLTKLYTDQKRANEEVMIRVDGNPFVRPGNYNESVDKTSYQVS